MYSESDEEVDGSGLIGSFDLDGDYLGGSKRIADRRGIYNSREGTNGPG